jgi:cytochrome c-type biogenesis protein CcmH
MRRLALALATLLCFVTAALAVEPDEILADPALEARAREISRELRCLVCQSQSIDDSEADLARDLRVLVRERLLAGDSDDEVRQYLVARYGDFVLLKPPLRRSTWLLWFGPAVILVLAVIVIWLRARRLRAPATPLPLSAEEQRRLDTLMRKDRAGTP